MFAPKTFLQLVVAWMVSELKDAAPELRAHALLYPGTDAGRQAGQLSKLCMQVTAPARLAELMKALTLPSYKGVGFGDWARLFEGSAKMIGTPPIKPHMPANDIPLQPSGKPGEGIRDILKREGKEFYLMCASPHHPWTAEFAPTIAKVAKAAAIMSRLLKTAEHMQKVFTDLADLALFLENETPV